LISWPSNKAAVVTPSSRINLDLPGDLVADTIGVRLLIILEYIIEQVMRHGKVAVLRESAIKRTGFLRCMLNVTCYYFIAILTD
jgi:hypothetical protein